VFVFNIHVTPDNDRCTNFDRQRLEIKTDGSSPAYVKGFLDDSVSYRWKFKLPDGFQPSPNFTHIHQIKAGDGDSGAPIITLTPRAGSPNSLQIIATDSNGTGTTLFQTDLAPFVGVWVEAFEQITYSHTGKYSVVIKTLDGTTLLSYSNSNIDMWRTEVGYLPQPEQQQLSAGRTAAFRPLLHCKRQRHLSQRCAHRQSHTRADRGYLCSRRLDCGSELWDEYGVGGQDQSPGRSQPAHLLEV
jgi:hypothetical protein